MSDPIFDRYKKTPDLVPQPKEPGAEQPVTTPDDVVVPEDTGSSHPIFSKYKKPNPILPRAVGVATENPEETANAVKLSKQSGLPVPVVQADPKQVQDHVTTTNVIDAVNRSDEVAKFYARPDAAIANDDLTTMEKIEKVAKTFLSAGLPKHIAYSWEVFKNKMEFEKPFGMTTQEGVENPNLYLWGQPFLAPLDFLFRGLGASIHAQGGFAGSMATDVLKVLNQLDPEGFKQYPRLWSGEESTRRRLTGDFTQMLEANLSGNTWTGFGHTTGAGFHRELMSQDQIRRASDAAKNITPMELDPLRPYDRYMDEQFRERDIAAGRIKLLPSPADARQGPIIDVTPNKPGGEPVNPVATQMVIEGEIPYAGMNKIIDKLQHEQVAADSAQFGELFTEVQASKVRERSPDAMEMYLTGMLDDRTVGVTPEFIHALYGDKAPHPEDGKLGFVSDLAERIERSQVTGTDVEIPMAKFLAHADPTVFQAIREGMRFRDNGWTKTESDEIKERQKLIDEGVVTPKDRISAEVVKYLREQAGVIDIDPASIIEKPADPNAPMMEELKPVAAKSPINKARTAEILGSQLYGELSNMTFVVTKELFQNAVDSIRPQLDDGTLKKGKVHIEFNNDARTITMTDNGHGMTPDVLSGPFLEIAGTGKESAKAGGGFGIAKIITFHTNEEIHVITMRDGVVSELHSTGDALREWLSDGPAPMIIPRKATKADLAMFPDGHGTRVQVKVPKDYVDSNTGQTQDINFSDYEVYHPGIYKSPLYIPVEITVSNTRYPKLVNTVKQGVHYDATKEVPLVNHKAEWGSSKITASKDQINFSSWNDNVSVLVNGLWQFDMQLEAGNEVIPRKFNIDIQSNVKPGKMGYPIAANRQDFSPTARAEFGKIFNYLQSVYQAETMISSAKSFGTGQYLDFDPNSGTTKVRPAFTISPDLSGMKTVDSAVSPTDVVSVVDGVLKVNGAELPEMTSGEMKGGYKIDSSKLMMDPSQIDLQNPMIHDNISVPDAASNSGRISVVQQARDKFGGRFDTFMFYIGGAFIQLRDTIADHAKLPQAKEFVTGISFDQKYRGVSIMVPMKGMFVNPGATISEKNPIDAAMDIVQTMIHEIAHVPVRNHGAEFPAEMQRYQARLDSDKYRREKGIIDQLSSSSSFDLWKFKTDMVEAFEKHADILDYLVDAVKLGEPIGERFREASYEETGNGGSNKGVAGKLPGGQGGVGDGARTPSAVEGHEGVSGQAPSGPEAPRSADEISGAAIRPRPAAPRPASAGAKATLGEAVTTEREALYLDPLFTRGKDVNVTQNEQIRYSRKIEDSIQEEADLIFAAEEREAKRKNSPEAQELYQKIEDQVRDDLKLQPDIAADRFFRLGDLPDGSRVTKIKLDSDTVKEMGGRSLVDLYTDQAGVHPDTIAGVFGFKTGQELVDALGRLVEERGKLTPKEYYDKKVKQGADELYKEMSREILDEAKEIALNDARFEVLIEELQILARMGDGVPPYTKEKLIKIAKDQVNELTARDAANYESFRRAAEKAGRAAEKMLLADKPREAYQAKQQQAIAAYSAKEAKLVQKEMKKALRKWNTLSKPKNPAVAADYMDQIHGILTRLNWPIKRDIPELLRGLDGVSLEKFSEQKMAEGQDLYIPTWWTSGHWNGTLKSMTLQEFRDIASMIDSLNEAGRRANFVKMGEKLVAFDEVKEQIISNLETLPRRDTSGKLKDMENSLYKIDASLTTMQSLSLDFDLKNPLGPFTNAVFRQAKKSMEHEERLLQDAAKKLKALRGTREWRKSLKTDVPNDVIMDTERNGGPMMMTKENLINVALNWGNKGNREEFIKGYAPKVPKGETPEEVKENKLIQRALEENFEHDVKAMLSKYMTKEDWDFVKGVWDLFEPLGKLADEMYRRHTGRGIKLVEAEAFDTPFGRMEGGYFPIIHDPLRSNITAVKEGEPLDNNYFRATPSNGYIVSRRGSGKPINLQSAIDDVPFRLQQQIHDIANREAIMDINKLIKDQDIRQAINRHYGVEYVPAMNDWLEYYANRMNRDEASMAIANNWLGAARKGFVLNLLGFNVNVALMIDPGLLTFNKAVTLSNMLRSPKQFVKDYSFAMESSQELRNSIEHMDRDMFEQFNNLTRYYRWDAVQQKAAYAAMWPVGMIGKTLRTVTWMSEYRDALKKGATHDDAVWATDTLVRQQHGSHTRIDLAPMFRANEGFKAFTVMQGYFNTAYQNTRTMGPDVKAGRFKDAWNSLTSYVLLGALLGYMFSQNALKNEDTWQGAARALLLQIAGLTPWTAILGALMEGNSPRNPWTAIFAAAYKGYTTAKQYLVDDKEAKNWLHAYLSLTGFLFRLPLNQIGKSTQFVANVKADREDPNGWLDWLNGLRKGNLKEHK